MKVKSLTDTQEKIIDISAKRFAKNGFQKTSLNDIAKAAKISKGTLFYHYPSKEDLFFVVLSQNIDSAFKEEFEYYVKQGFKLFKDRNNLLHDLATYYDSRMVKPKLIERLWLEGVIESEHNPKLQQMLSKKDDEIVQRTAEMLRFARTQIGILEGFDDSELSQMAQGLAAFFRGMFLYRIMGKDVDELKNIWVLTVYNLYISGKHSHDK
ncbi:MAG: TetR family transcriptional regulator [Nitrosopumilus sp.]|nr:MAG: TetR family transcriptional regulator [Nitrosopumilus sp.]